MSSTEKKSNVTPLFQNILNGAKETELSLEPGVDWEDSKQKFDIISLYGKDTLETIQDRISKATGLAFVTVDYKGEPVTKMTSFTHFCSAVRKSSEEGKKRCMSSDAYGAIQAAVTCKTNVYLCPCGLMEVAIPIIIDGQYLGGFIGGQIRCRNVPENSVANLKNLMPYGKDYLKDSEMQEMFHDIPEMEYEKFLGIADLVSLIITQLGENEIARRQQKEYLRHEMKYQNLKKQAEDLKKEVQKAEVSVLKAQLNPHFLYNCINSISNLAILEHAEKTNELAVMFAGLLRHNIKNIGKILLLEEEMRWIELYLEIQKIRLGDKLSFSIVLEEGLEKQKVPPFLILPFVENAILYRILPQIDGGAITITARYQDNDVVITVEDTGEEDPALFEQYDSMANGEQKDPIEIGISSVRKRLTVAFGETYDVVTRKISGRGVICSIRFPKDFNEKDV